MKKGKTYKVMALCYVPPNYKYNLGQLMYERYMSNELGCSHYYVSSNKNALICELSGDYNGQSISELTQLCHNLLKHTNLKCITTMVSIIEEKRKV